MRLVIGTGAQQDLREIPESDAARVVAALQQVADAYPQRLSFVTELVGRRGEWRLRKGSVRAFYRFEDEDMVVFEVGRRKEIYR